MIDGACRSAIVLGSLVPLMMFLSWEAVSLNLLPFGLTVAGSPAEAGLLPDPAIIMEAAYHPPAPAAAAVAATMAAMPAEFEEVAVAAAGAGEAAAAAAGGGVSVDSVAGMTVDPLQVGSLLSSMLCSQLLCVQGSSEAGGVGHRAWTLC